MKVRKAVCAAIFGLGCAVTFVGALATLLPMIQNDQLRLVLSSFGMPSDNVVVNVINSAMTYALQNCYLVMLTGAVTMLAGLGALLWENKRARRNARAYHAPYSRPVAAGSSPADWPATEPDWPVQAPNPFADTAYRDLLSPRAPDPAIPAVTAYTPPPILPRQKDSVPEASPYARPAVEPLAAQAAAREETATGRLIPGRRPVSGEAWQAEGESAAFTSGRESAASVAAQKPAAPASAWEPDASASARASVASGLTQEPLSAQRPALVKSPVILEEPVEGQAGQSGSHVVIRTTVSAKNKARPAAARQKPPSALSDTAGQAAAPAGVKIVLDGVEYERNEPSVETAARPAASRVKSTMGKHSV